MDKKFFFVIRLLMAWTFLYAASHQVGHPEFSITRFLGHTKTFHDLFSIFTGETLAPIVSFCVAYGHLAIGLSLLTGTMVRVSGLVAAALMMLYWMAHLDFPFVENKNNFIIDYHITYAVLLVWLSFAGAGRFWGLDGRFAKMNSLKRWRWWFSY